MLKDIMTGFAVVFAAWTCYMVWVWGTYKTPEAVKIYLARKFENQIVWKVLYYGYLIGVALALGCFVIFIIANNP